MSMSNSSTRKLSTSSDADLKRAEIVKAATKLFAQHGFHATGMRDLCEAVGLSAGAFYRYFASKEDIITTLIESDRAQTQQWFEEVPTNIGLIEALTLLIRNMIKSIDQESYLAMWTEIQAEAARNPKVRAMVLNHSLEAEAKLSQLIDLAIEKRSVAKDVVPKDAARLIITNFDGLMVRRSYDPNFDFTKGARSCLQFIAHALGAPQPRL
jgi:AcrR family transcriptional regulator